MSAILGWLERVWDQLGSISLPLLLLGLALQTSQTCLNALAWRNILRAAYPRAPFRYRQILGSYAGGVGINAILPAQAGTVAMLGLFRAEIEGSTVAGVLGAGVVQNIFFAAVGASIYVILFVSRPGAFDVHLSLLHQHWLASLLIVVAGTFLVVLVARVLWHRFRTTWENAKEGAAILSTPGRYVTRVVAVEIASYLARMGVNATFMHAYGVPVSARNVLLVIAANSISSTLAVTPGGVGTQQALASVALRRAAPASVVTAYSLGQQLITTAWNVVFGLTMLATTIGWSQTRELIAQERAEAKRKKADKKAARRHSGDAPAAEPPSDGPADEG